MTMHSIIEVWGENRRGLEETVYVPLWNGAPWIRVNHRGKRHIRYYTREPDGAAQKGELLRESDNYEPLEGADREEGVAGWLEWHFLTQLDWSYCEIEEPDGPTDTNAYARRPSGLSVDATHDFGDIAVEVVTSSARAQQIVIAIKQAGGSYGFDTELRSTAGGFANPRFSTFQIAPSADECWLFDMVKGRERKVSDNREMVRALRPLFEPATTACLAVVGRTRKQSFDDRYR